MFTQSLELSNSTLENLFKQGQCLTFCPRESAKYCRVIEKNRNLKNTWISSSIAKLALDYYHVPFHYFSNGVLIHGFSSSDDNSVRLARIEKMLSAKGYEIKIIYGPQKPTDLIYYSEFLRKISEYALNHYPIEKSLIFESIPDITTFTSQCFKNNNILLTASKYESVNEQYRSCLALFEDGSFYISDKYKSGNYICDSKAPANFKMAYLDYYYLEPRYVPQEYIDALYHKAQKYEWYKPIEENKNISNDKNKSQMEDYINYLLTNRKCISITNPADTISFITRPDHNLFVLFNDGKLVLCKDKPSALYSITIKDLEKIYPNLEFDVEYVAEYYIGAIYHRLSKIQKTAKDIYIEMLKQKARNLKKMLGITHHEALETCAKMVGFKNFKEALSINENNARYAIDRENWKKQNAIKNGEDYIKKEYEKYLKS